MPDTEESQSPWDDQTDEYISAIDPVITDEFGISLQDLLINPDKYVDTKDIVQKIDNIKNRVNKFFSDLMVGMDDERTRLNHDMENANMQYMKINDSISSKSLAARVPYIKPFFLDTNPDTQEEIVIDQYNNSVDSLITKLIGISNFIADVSGKYKTYTLGSWIFSSERTYMLSINQPSSVIMALEGSNDNIINMLDTVAGSLKRNVENK